MFTLNLHAVAVSAIKVVNLPVFMNDAVDTSPPTIDVDCISAAIIHVAAIFALVTASVKILTPLITIFYLLLCFFVSGSIAGVTIGSGVTKAGGVGGVIQTFSPHFGQITDSILPGIMFAPQPHLH
jgi:succinate-acetate transporter protein